MRFVSTIILFTILFISFGIHAQQVEIEWDGDEADVIRFVEGGKMRFSIEGHTAATPDRITFKIRSGDSLINSLTLFEGGTVRIEKVDTTSTGASTIVRMSDGTLAVRRLEIGDIAHGGIVFYVDESGEHGLVAATSDQNAGVGVVWSSTGIETGAKGRGIYAGEMNSLLIVSENRTGISAARVCLDLHESKFGDWYLPSREELLLMKTELHDAGLGNFTNTGYWNSSEDFNLGCIIDFNGGSGCGSKAQAFRVRAVRRF